jgi:transposase-like protein
MIHHKAHLCGGQYSASRNIDQERSAFLWTSPREVDRKISVKYKKGEEQMGKAGTKRRVYTPEFKAESVALVEKHEKPVRQTAADLGINENMPRRWVQSAREAAGAGLKPFPGHGRPRDEELIRLRKENKALRNANEILKKANVPQAHVIFAQGGPPVTAYRFYTSEPGNLHRKGDDRAVGVKRRHLLPVGHVRTVSAAVGSGRRVAAPHRLAAGA